jgi:hypothetical protein
MLTTQYILDNTYFDKKDSGDSVVCAKLLLLFFRLDIVAVPASICVRSTDAVSSVD